MHGIVYVITNAVNGKRYVGQTTIDPDLYWRRHIIASRFAEKPLYSAIRKYGESAFNFEVIWHADSKESLDVSEDSFIKLFDTIVPNGYNLKGGGSTGKFSKETKDKVSNNLKNALNIRGPGRLITDGKVAKLILMDSPIPEGWSLGAGWSWITNGYKNTHLSDNDRIPIGWWLGKTEPRFAGTERARKTGIAVSKAHRSPEAVAKRLASIEQIRPKLRAAHKRRLSTPEARAEQASHFGSIGTRWITNGVDTIRINSPDPVPNGWRYGRVFKQ